MFKLRCKRHYRNLATYSWCKTWRKHVTKTAPARRRHAVGGDGGGAAAAAHRSSLKSQSAPVKNLYVPCPLCPSFLLDFFRTAHASCSPFPFYRTNAYFKRAETSKNRDSGHTKLEMLTAQIWCYSCTYPCMKNCTFYVEMHACQTVLPCEGHRCCHDITVFYYTLPSYIFTLLSTAVDTS